MTSNVLIEIVQGIFGVTASDVLILNRIMGGYSNHLYLIEVQGQKLTLRIPGENAELFVDREIEGYHLALINKLQMNSRVAYFNPKTGIKVSEYIEGICFVEMNYKKHLDKVSNILKTLHHSEKSKHDYNPFKHLETYESYLKHFSHPTAYDELKTFLFELKDEITYTSVMTHGDCQPANFVFSNTGELYLLDWEFSGNNDALYDIACFGDENWEDAEMLLPVYLDREPTDDEWIRLYYWGLFQSLQWYNVAIFKEQNGMSEKLQIDFGDIADFFIEKSTELKSKIEAIKG